MKLLCPVLTLVAIMLLCSVSAADLHYGVKGGLSLATQDFDYSEALNLDTSHRSGLAAGVFVEWDGILGFGVLAEALYVQRGMELQEAVVGPDDPEPTGTLTVDERVDYVSFPILLKRRLGVAGWGVYGAAGPRFDLLLDYHAKLGFEDVYDDFSDLDVGADVAVGVDIGRLLVEVRYGLTFTESYKTDLLNVTNSSLLILAGLRF